MIRTPISPSDPFYAKLDFSFSLGGMVERGLFLAYLTDQVTWSEAIEEVERERNIEYFLEKRNLPAQQPLETTQGS